MSAKLYVLSALFGARCSATHVRELNVTGSEVVVRTDGNTIFLTNLKVSASKAGDSRERTRRYDFNYCFDSSDPDAENYANQSRIYETLGQSVLDALFTGYNACFVAYGQSASGKTYTMMGSKDDPGLTPRLCEGIFARIQEEERKERNRRVTVSYLEIYNDRVRDLLKPAASGRGLKVREHPRLGPYVQGLTHHVVGTLGSLMSYVEEGTRARKTALTLQNSSSSRSHALLTVSLSSETCGSLPSGGSSIGEACIRRKDGPRGGSGGGGGGGGGGGNKLHLVDLAGSESAATCSGVNRLKEGANINKSLVALGNVISALAERGSTGSGPGRRFIPYRDSSLTWLLKDALGGNATTIMLATISPASGSYNETAHTLRFAQRAQSVVNRPVVNENPVARIIRELRDEVARLKSLLLEKENIDPGSKSLCCCKEIQTVDNPDSDKDQSASSELSSDRRCMEVKNRSRSTERAKEEERDAPSIRRFNSTESLSTSDSGSSGPIRKFGSFEFLSAKSPLAVCNYYNRAKVTELNDEEDEIVDEINEPVFVDIPTLVAVLIKPDDSLPGSSTQIEEICSDEVQEDSIDVEFIENANGQEVFENIEKLERVEREETGSVNSAQLSADVEPDDCQRNTEEGHVSAASGRSREKGKFRKQDSIDVVTHSGSSNLHTSKRFGSVEGLQKKKEPHLALERSHTNLEKRPAASDRTKKLNNIREIDDQKAHGKQLGGWKGIASSGSKDHLQRKGSNDSDKSLKESNGGQSGPRSKNGTARKPSLENLKRKTSKDSSSSSSKEEQIVISNLTRDKLLRRKGSLDQEPPVVRAHTPIQRVKRAEIVAAVTERLYASRKHVEESTAGSTPGSGTRSPPEAADIKLGSPFTTRTKLQEISRKMLAKRRRVCVDTQTDIDRTVRVKDTASLTEEPQVILQDAAVLTDHHENCEVSTESSRVPVLRVKEIATLTDKPRTTIVRCKDAESLATDLDDYDYEIHSPRNDSGILSDDTQNYAESNLSSTEVSDACIETDRRVVCTDSSTNTMYLSPGRSPIPIPQAPRQELIREQPKAPRCDRQCCNVSPEVSQVVTPVSSEKNVISISLPDMISITIESTNGIESRIAMTDCSDSAETVTRPKLRDIEAQTDERSARKDENNESADSHFCFKDLPRSAAGLTDGKIFRIENIFQDPKIASKACARVDTVSDAGEDSGPRRSVTFTNSLGTSFVPDTRERATEMEREKIHAVDKAIDFQKRTSFAQAFVSKRRGRSLPEAPQSAFCSNSPTICTCPPVAIDSAEFKKEFEIVSPGWQRACNETSRNGLIFSCHSGVVCMAANNCVPFLMKRRQIDYPYDLRAPYNVTTLPTCDRCTNLRESCMEKPPTISRLDAKNDYECNFSDDSLDYDEDDASNDSQPAKDDVKNRENHDNLCPPDVVAHTKKDASTSSGYMDENTESSANSDFEDSHVELPRKKADMCSGSKVHDYKTLILGDPLIMFSESSVEEEDGCKTPSSQSSGNSKKRVSFSNVTEERSQRKLDRQASEPKQSSHVELKSIIKKKKKKSSMPETLERSQSSTDSTSTDDSVHSKMSLTDDSQDSCRVFEAATAKLEKHLGSIGNGQDFDEFSASQTDGGKSARFTGQEYDDNDSETDSECNGLSDEEYSGSVRRDIVREYLDQATTFMRNMNSMNEYMNATKMLDRYLGRGKRRGHRRRGYRPQNQDYVEYQGRRISLKDDPAECIDDDDDDDIVVPIESYERCLASINRLESCIERVNRHNDLLREKYNIDAESAGARHDLARTSSDPTAHRSWNDTVKANPTIVVPPENVSRSCRAPTSSWLADQADYGRDSDAAERHIVKQISDLDLDRKNGDARHGSGDDLEKRIFDQLMSVVESSRCTKRLRDRYPSETLDLRSGTPTTYSRSRLRYRSEKQDFLSRDIDGSLGRPMSPMESALNNNQVEIDSLRAASASTMPAMYESLTSVSRRSRSLDNADSEEHDLSVSDELTGPARTKNVCARSYESDAYSRRIKDFVPSKRISSTGIGPSKIENSRLGDNVGATVKSIDTVSYFRDKLKYPGSPRVKFLELLNERRRIVESTRGMGAS